MIVRSAFEVKVPQNRNSTFQHSNMEKAHLAMRKLSFFVLVCVAWHACDLKRHVKEHKKSDLTIFAFQRNSVDHLLR